MEKVYLARLRKLSGSTSAYLINSSPCQVNFSIHGTNLIFFIFKVPCSTDKLNKVTKENIRFVIKIAVSNIGQGDISPGHILGINFNFVLSLSVYSKRKGIKKPMTCGVVETSH